MTPERLAEIRERWSLPLGPTDRYPSDWADVAELLTGIERLTRLLGSHADGHRCTCTMTKPAVYHGSNMGPSEWEQDPWCLTHPDMDYIMYKVGQLRKQVANLLSLFTYESLGEPGRLYARFVGDVEVTDEVRAVLAAEES